MNEKYPLALPPGTVLAGQYIIEAVLGQGGFGITYRAADHKNGNKVAVKEFFPDTLAARNGPAMVSAYSGPREENFIYGKNCFLQEAETLAKFIGNDNIVRVHSYFEENGTAYFVMDYIEGISFAEYIRHYNGKIPYDKALNVLIPVMDALGAVHNQGIIHRDVTPDNIYISSDGIVKLMDFGAARYSLGDRSQSLDVVLKHGYAPKEQYMRRGRQGPFTDVYSLGACFYFSVTGKLPPDSVDRLDVDEIVSMSALGADLPAVSEAAIMKALSVKAEDRFQSMEDFKLALFGRKPVTEPEPSPVKQVFFAAPDGDEKDTAPSKKREEKGTALSRDRKNRDTAPSRNRLERRPNDHGKPGLHIIIACACAAFIALLIILGTVIMKAREGGDKEKSTAVQEASEESSISGETDKTDSKQTSDVSDTEEDISGTEASSGDSDAADTRGKAQLGIMGMTVTEVMMEQDGTPAGAYVTDLLEGSGAAASGLQERDVITKVNGRIIPSMETLQEEIRGYQVGDTVTLTIERPGDNGYEEMELKLTLTAKEEV